MSGTLEDDQSDGAESGLSLSQDDHVHIAETGAPFSLDPHPAPFVHSSPSLTLQTFHRAVHNKVRVRLLDLHAA